MKTKGIKKMWMEGNNGTFDVWSMRPKEYFQMQDRQITRGLSLNRLTVTSCWYPKV